jgi:hypothetical protein
MGKRLRLTWMGLLVLSLSLTACGKDPEQVAQDFYEAFEHHEFSKAKGYVCSDLHDELDTWIETEGDNWIGVNLDVEYKQIKKDKDLVVIRVTGTKRLGEQVFAVDYQIRVEKPDDDWLVCDMREWPG